MNRPRLKSPRRHRRRLLNQARSSRRNGGRARVMMLRPVWPRSARKRVPSGRCTAGSVSPSRAGASLAGETKLADEMIRVVHVGAPGRRVDPKYTAEEMGRPTGFEPATPRSTILCSNQLSYDRREKGTRNVASARGAVNPFVGPRLRSQRTPFTAGQMRHPESPCFSSGKLRIPGLNRLFP